MTSKVREYLLERVASLIVNKALGTATPAELARLPRYQVLRCPPPSPAEIRCREELDWKMRCAIKKLKAALNHVAGDASPQETADKSRKQK